MFLSHGTRTGKFWPLDMNRQSLFFDFSDSNQWLHQTELKLDVAVSDQNSFQYSNIELNTIIEDATVRCS